MYSGCHRNGVRCLHCRDGRANRTATYQDRNRSRRAEFCCESRPHFRGLTGRPLSFHGKKPPIGYFARELCDLRNSIFFGVGVAFSPLANRLPFDSQKFG